MMYFASFLSDFSTIINLTLALAVLLGGTYIARIRLQAGKESTDRQILRESNEDLQKIHYADQLIISQLRKENELLKQSLEALQKNYETLESIKFQAPSIVKMMKQSDTQHQQVMTGLTSLTEKLSLIAENILKEGRRGRK